MDVYGNLNRLTQYLLDSDPVRGIIGSVLAIDGAISLYGGRTHPPSSKYADLWRMARTGMGFGLIYESLAGKSSPLVDIPFGALMIADGIISIVYAYKKCDDKFILLHILRATRTVVGGLLIYYSL